MRERKENKIKDKKQGAEEEKKGKNEGKPVTESNIRKDRLIKDETKQNLEFYFQQHGRLIPSGIAKMLNKIFKMSFECVAWLAGKYRDGSEARNEECESQN